MEYPKLTEIELRELDAKLSEYTYTRDITYPIVKTLTVHDFAKFHRDMNTTNSDNCIILKDIERNKGGSVLSCTNKFEELEDKISQWGAWKGRKEYGKKKQLEGYEEMVKGMDL